MVSKDEFRKCMSEFATGVTVVTTLDDEDQMHGMSANSFTSVCLAPPLVLVCVAHNTNTFRFIESRGCFGVNILSSTQEDLGKYFARKPEDRHGDVEYSSAISTACDVPVLKDVLVFFGCQVVDSHLYGDHTIYIAEVKEIQRSGSSDAPLVFYESRWFPDLEMA